MISFTKPTNLNGAELLAELQTAGLTIDKAPMVDGNGVLWLDLDEKNKVKATTVVESHNGTIIAPALTVAEKLASVGLSIEDLKGALS